MKEMDKRRRYSRSLSKDAHIPASSFYHNSPGVLLDRLKTWLQRECRGR